MALLVSNWRIKDGTLSGSVGTGGCDAFSNVANIVSTPVVGRKGVSLVVDEKGLEYFLTPTPDRDAVLSALPSLP